MGEGADTVAAGGASPAHRELQALGFTSFRHQADCRLDGRTVTLSHEVFHAAPDGSGAAPALLLMHELPGLNRACVGFARRLLAAGFAVYMPHLVGPLLQDAMLGNLRQLCISAEFARLKAGQAAPVADWLRSLADRISAERGGAPIGAIGMCLTGAFVVPLVLAPGVRAVVASQPAIPFRLGAAVLGLGLGGDGAGGGWQQALNLSDAQLDAAARCAAAEGKAVLVQRFAADRLCPGARMDRLAAAFGAQAIRHDWPTSPRRPWRPLPPHALLTEEFDLVNQPEPAPDSDPTRQALDRLVAFFRQHLGATPG